MTARSIPAYQLKGQLCQLSQLLWARRLLRDEAGSLSVSAGGEVWVTPSGVHPALLTPDALLRVGRDGRVYGQGHIDPGELAQHLRVQKLSPKTGAVFVLAPLYLDVLREEDVYPEAPSGPVDPDLPLSDRAKTARAFLWDNRLVCWGEALPQLFVWADALDCGCFARFFHPNGGNEREQKARLMEQVAASVTRRLSEKGGVGL